MFSGSEIPEVAYRGQIIYRTDTQNIQVYNGTAWEEVVGGDFNQSTYVQADPPTSPNLNDLWYDTDDGHKLYVYDGALWQALLVTEQQIAEGAVTQNKISTSAVDALRLSSTLVLTTKIILGVTDAEGNITGSYMVLDKNGAQLFDENGQPKVTMSTADGAIPQFEGNILTNNLVVDGIQIVGTEGTVAAGAELELAATVKPPKSAPTLEVYYDQVSFYTGAWLPHPSSAGSLGLTFWDPSLIVSLAWDPTFGKWVTLTEHTATMGSANTGTRAWFWNTDGTLYVEPGAGVPYIRDYPNSFSMTGHGRTASGQQGFIYSYLAPSLSTSRFTFVRCPDGTYRRNRIPAGLITDTRHRPFFSYDAINNQYLLTYGDQDSQTMKVHRLSSVNTLDGNMTVNSTFTTADDSFRSSMVMGSMYGQQIRTGTNRYTMAVAAGTKILVFATTDTEIDVDEFDMATSGIKGLAHDGDNFFMIDSSGVLTKFTNWEWTSGSDTVSGAYTWHHVANNDETLPSPVQRVTMSKRANLRVSTPASPVGAGDDPDAFKFYAVRASVATTSTMTYQFTGDATEATSTVVDDVTTGGANPPTSPTFPSATSGKIVSGAEDANGPLLSFQGDGFGRWEWGSPSGSLRIWAGDQGVPPDGWLLADGTTKTRATYPYLFAVIGTTYNTGGESGTVFRLPNPATYGGLKLIIKT